MPPDRRSRSAVKRHEVPAWWRDAKLGIFVHWTPASVPAFAPVDADMGELLARRHPAAMAWSPYAEWYENSLRFPGSPAALHHSEIYGSRPYSEFAGEWEAALAGWDRRLGGALRRLRGSLRRPRDQAPRRLLPVADGGRQRAPAWLALPPRRRRGAGAGGSRPGDALRRLLLGRARLDVQRPSDRIVQRPVACPTPRRLHRLRRGAGTRADRPLPAERALERHRGRRHRAGWPPSSRPTTATCPMVSSTIASCHGRRSGGWPRRARVAS